MSDRSTRNVSGGRASRTDWARLRSADDRSIDYSDIPKTAPEFWARARLRLPARKIPVSIRLDEDVIAWFREQGGRYQTRMNAVLRAYMDSRAYEPDVRDRVPASRKEQLLADLAAARATAEQLVHLGKAVPPAFFPRVQAKIEARADSSHLLKLPVLFFFLIRRDLGYLREFDTLVGSLSPRHRKNLFDRLCREEDYRDAVGAIFEVDILGRLLDTAPAGTVMPHPAVAGAKAQKEADASIRLASKTLHIEATVLSQTREQEKVQDISVERGVGDATTGDPYGDALRVIGKLHGKRGQFHPREPNVLCLGLADSLPHPISVDWAVKNFFSGTPTVPRIVLEQSKDERARVGLERLIRNFKPEPRLTGVLTFQVQRGRPAPLEAFKNESAGEANALDDGEWNQILRLFGFLRGALGDAGRSMKRRASGSRASS